MESLWNRLGVYPADILLPKDADMTAWAVVACDQFTSQPAYWEKAEALVGEKPSTLRLVLPELKLHSAEVEQEIAAINETMEQYLAHDLFKTYESAIIYLERTQSDGAIRRGLVAAIDLEQYDYTPGSGSLIRATEGTVLERIPPRVRVREKAPMELPHVMLLIDDPQKTCIEPVSRETAAMENLYDFPLMLGGGHAKAWLLTKEQQERLADALSRLLTPAEMEKKYGMKDAAPLLFAVGDGNHSLATAKTCWENLKKTLTAEEQASHPARFALVEIVNLHDDALNFEPIHRVVFGVEPRALLDALLAFYPGSYEGEGEGHVIRCVSSLGETAVTVPHPAVQLSVGTLQNFLDEYIKENGGTVDYIHGDDVTRELGKKPGNMGFLLPGMGKDQLFKTVMADGVLPRKTFSMGHAEDKRYYVEGRMIR